MCKMKHCLLLFSLLIASTLQFTSDRKTYRADYEYNSKTNAFYKLHIEQTHQADAIQLCAMEGATLMIPSSKEDLIQVHRMIKKFPDIGTYVWIASDGKTHESAEEQPIINLDGSDSQEYEFVSTCDILTREGEIETANCFFRHPFICKVGVKDAPYDDQCGVYGIRYEYYTSAGSCYKVPLIALSWYEAVAECRAEGAHLAILNSEAEHHAVWDIIRTAPTVDGSMSNLYFLAGIKANTPSLGTSKIWKTIFNETLQEAGYDKLTDADSESESCGTISLADGRYNAVDCTHRYQFICETEVQSTQTTEHC